MVESLMRKKKKGLWNEGGMPSFLFAANYELKHIASTDAVFTVSPVFTEEVPLIHNGYTHIDAAYGGNDYTAMTCAKKQFDGTIVMYGRLWKKDVMSVMEGKK